MRIELIEDPDIPLHDVSLVHVTLQHTSLCTFFYYSRGTLSVTFYLYVSAEDVSTRSAGGITVGREALNNGAEILFLVGRHRLEAMQKLHVENDVC